MWVHSLLAGVDRVIKYATKFDIFAPITNAKGAFSNSLAEYCLAAILYFNKQLPRLEQNRTKRIWDKFRMNTLAGKTVGFLGYGSIGEATAKLCKSVGLDVLAAKRTPSPVDADEYASKIFATDDQNGMSTFLRSSDYVVCTLPATAKTNHFCSTAFFSSMKSTAIFISVGRGETVDEVALATALSDGTIAGAALDVFEKEPLPKSSPLWSYSNCLISSHNADWINSYLDDSLKIFEGNLRRFLANERLENLVSSEDGY